MELDELSRKLARWYSPDAAQDAIEALLKRREPPDNTLAFCRRVAKCSLRKERRIGDGHGRPARELLSAVDSPTGGVMWIGEPEPTDPQTPEQRLLSREELERVPKALVEHYTHGPTLHGGAIHKLRELCQ